MPRHLIHERRFDGKSALVTAGASGIGRGIVERLVAEGARVVVGDIADEQLSLLESEFGGRVIGVHCDVSEERDVDLLVDRAVSAHGRLDCAFNVAGLSGGGGMLLNTAVDQWQAAQDVTLLGTFLTLKRAGRQFIEQGNGGVIVNIASINALTAAEHAGAYNAAKAGVVNLTKTAAIEFGEYGIRVNAVGPGLVDTPMTAGMTQVPALVAAFRDATPLERRGVPADIAAAATFLASDDAQWITGQTLYVDGGQTVTGYPRLNRLLSH
jgi:NAD(P)-dependent dehydrogenase (short-subunit alcohol dehydrogenase family)